MSNNERYSKQLVDANNGVGERRGAALIWRGQTIDRIALPEAVDDRIGPTHRWPAGAAVTDRAAAND